jgi:hypothetical protein
MFKVGSYVTAHMFSYRSTAVLQPSDKPCKNKKGKVIRLTGRRRLWRYDMSRTLHLLDNGSEIVVMLLALRPTALYPQKDLLVLISVIGSVNPRALVRIKDFGKLKEMQ